MAASYPNGIKEFDSNTDNVTVVNADYMNQRDEEIVAIEKALGMGLVPAGPDGNTKSLGHYIKVSSWSNNYLVLKGNLDVESGRQVHAAYNIGGEANPLYEAIGAQTIVPQGGGQPNIGAGGFGIVSGINQASPVVWLWAYGGLNAFRVILKRHNTEISTDPVLFNVTTGGYVGIGTTQPTTKLHVKGDTIRLEDSQTGSGPPSGGNEGDITWMKNGSSDRELWVKVNATVWKKVQLV